MKSILSGLLVLSVAMTAQAELKPNQIAVLAMSDSQDGKRIATYYAKTRGIPESHICLLPGRPGERISREAFDEQMRPGIARWLRENELDQQIECLVTCWDVPLKISKRPATHPVTVARTDYLTRYRKTRVEHFVKVLHMLDTVGTLEPVSAAPPQDPNIKLEALLTQYNQSLVAMQQRAKQLDEQAKRTANNNVMKIYSAIGGIRSLTSALIKIGATQELSPEATNRIEMYQGINTGLKHGLKALNILPDSVARDAQILPLIQAKYGLGGVIQWIDQQLPLLKKNETHAAFDSELSLLHWPSYPLFFVVNNDRHYRFDNIRPPHKTLMVSRLAAPNIDLVKQLIDTGIEVESKGLVGQVYLDARGMKTPSNPKKSGGYATYDQSLRDLASRLKTHTDLVVVLDNQGRLFQPGDCPEAALYCGWYALAQYVDAFDWRPGAIGYHLASLEATRLRVPGNKAWCNAALEDGITATLGPVEEPYLTAFPLPDEFFSLLLTGRFTLAETYYRTKPFNSWQMTLVGDPLYNPFKKNPQLTEEELPESMRKKAEAQKKEEELPSPII